jgi:hypothetical protein
MASIFFRTLVEQCRDEGLSLASVPKSELPLIPEAQPFADVEWERIMKHLDMPDEARRYVESAVCEFKEENADNAQFKGRPPNEVRRLLRSLTKSVPKISKALEEVLGSSATKMLLYKRASWKPKHMPGELNKLATWIGRAEKDLKPRQRGPDTSTHEFLIVELVRIAKFFRPDVEIKRTYKDKRVRDFILDVLAVADHNIGHDKRLRKPISRGGREVNHVISGSGLVDRVLRDIITLLKQEEAGKDGASDLISLPRPKGLSQ